MVQYYFFFIISHNQMANFCSKYIEVSPSYWHDLFSANFQNLKYLNLSLSCNDDILRLIPAWCTNLEILNASARYVLKPISAHQGRECIGIQLAVSDAGLRHLRDCKKLRALTINEPRGERPSANNHITYDGLRYLLRNIPTLEDISYSDIGNVISTNFYDIEQLNLKVVRHINPTHLSIRRILSLCREIKKLCLREPIGDSADIVKEICRAKEQTFNEIEFQNICFGDRFDQFFHTFGENLVSVSISSTVSENISFDQIAVIGNSCPNLEYFLCNDISKAANDEYVFAACPSSVRPFAELRSLHISGVDLDLSTLLPHFTKYSTHLAVLKIHELCHVRVADGMLLNCINGESLRQLEVSRLRCSRYGIECLIEKFTNLKFIVLTCTDDCRELIARMKSLNYEIVMIVNSPCSLF